MGTNYYRIPSVEEMEERKQRLLKEVNNISLDIISISNNFRTTIKMDDYSQVTNPWERFTDGVKIHLGKKSIGWKFIWNFHHNKYYYNKESLFDFISTGRIINEYGEEIDINEFKEISLNWNKDGYDAEKYSQEHKVYYNYNDCHEKYIDGLRVSTSTEFS
jgi:hypothetical protein